MQRFGTDRYLSSSLTESCGVESSVSLPAGYPNSPEKEQIARRPFPTSFQNNVFHFYLRSPFAPSICHICVGGGGCHEIERPWPGHSSDTLKVGEKFNSEHRLVHFPERGLWILRFPHLVPRALRLLLQGLEAPMWQVTFCHCFFHFLTFFLLLLLAGLSITPRQCSQSSSYGKEFKIEMSRYW